jgi:hypothetical protein
MEPALALAIVGHLELVQKADAVRCVLEQHRPLIRAMEAGEVGCGDEDDKQLTELVQAFRAVGLDAEFVDTALAFIASIEKRRQAVADIAAALLLTDSEAAALRGAFLREGEGVAKGGAFLREATAAQLQDRDRAPPFDRPEGEGVAKGGGAAEGGGEGGDGGGGVDEHKATAAGGAADGAGADGPEKAKAAAGAEKEKEKDASTAAAVPAAAASALASAPSGGAAPAAAAATPASAAAAAAASSLLPAAPVPADERGSLPEQRLWERGARASRIARLELALAAGRAVQAGGAVVRRAAEALLLLRDQAQCCQDLAAAAQEASPVTGVNLLLGLLANARDLGVDHGAQAAARGAVEGDPAAGEAASAGGATTSAAASTASTASAASAAVAAAAAGLAPLLAPPARPHAKKPSRLTLTPGELQSFLPGLGEGEDEGEGEGAALTERLKRELRPPPLPDALQALQVLTQAGQAGESPAVVQARAVLVRLQREAKEARASAEAKQIAARKAVADATACLVEARDNGENVAPTLEKLHLALKAAADEGLGGAADGGQGSRRSVGGGGGGGEGDGDGDGQGGEDSAADSDEPELRAGKLLIAEMATQEKAMKLERQGRVKTCFAELRRAMRSKGKDNIDSLHYNTH